ncbi:MAG: hypothetical protein P8L49_16545 [Opitutaceae bacterium]|nr:hypothetical protein [Opitutaceae bacterium]
MKSTPEFYKRLCRQRSLLLLAVVCWFALIVSGIGAFGVLLLEGVNSSKPLQEQNVFYVVVGLAFLLVGLFAVGIVIILRRRPTVVALTRVIEERFPDLMEMLTCSVEIVERKMEPEGPFESSLIAQAEERTRAIPFFSVIVFKRIHPVWMGILAVAWGGLLFFAIQSEVAQKAGFFYREHGGGIAVAPGSVELPIGADLVIKAEVTRWQKDAHIVYKQEGETERYSLSTDSEGDLGFTFYGLTDGIDYQVRTASLQSEWYRIDTYQPPVIERTSIDVVPPTYTGAEATHLDAFSDLLFQEGSRVRFELEFDSGVSVQLKWNEQAISVDGEVAISPKEDGTYQFSMLNQEGRKNVTEVYQIETIPDEVPVVEIVLPREDIKAAGSDAVGVELYSGDDYGITRVELHLSVSGKKQPPVLVYEKQAMDVSLRELSNAFLMTLENLHAQESDVISYYATVWDNKEPVHQMGKTELFFVEIIGEDEEPESGPEMEGGPPPEKNEIDLRAVIVELKRLIRLSNESLFLVGDEFELNVQEVGAGLAALQKEGVSILEELKVGASNPKIGEVIIVLNEAFEQVGTAERKVNDDKLEASLFSQYQAYRGLLVAEELLKENQPSEGEGESGEPSDSEKEDSELENDSESPSMSMAEMKRALEELNQLVDAQSNMNTRFRRAERLNSSREELRELSDLQEEIEKQVARLDHELLQSEGLEQVRDYLKRAEKEMDIAASRARLGDPGKSKRSGDRAKQALLNASDRMSAGLEQLASGSLRSLEKSARSLAAREATAAAESREQQASGGSSESAEALRDEQMAISEDLKTLLSEFDKAAVELEDHYSELSQELLELAQKVRESSVDRQMKRAVNALLYERFDRAAKEQESAADELGALARDMGDISGKVPSMTHEQMNNLMKRIEDARQELAEAWTPGEGEIEGEGQGESVAQEQGKGQGEGEGQGDASGMGRSDADGSIQRLAEQEGILQGIGGRLMEAGGMLKNETLTKLGREMQAPEGGADTTGEGGASADDFLDEAERVLQGLINADRISEKTRVIKQSSQAPEKYKTLVEEYFKELAEEQ